MATIKDRVEPYAGDIDSWHGVNLNTIGDQIAADAVSNIIGIIQAQQPEMMHLFSTDNVSDNTGSTNGWSSYVYALNDTEKVVNVFLEDYVCVEVPSILERQVQQTESNYFATATSPVFLRKNKNVYVYPSGGSRKATMRIISHDQTIDISTDTSITGFTSEFLLLVALHVAKFLLSYKLYLMQTLLPELSDSSDGASSTAGESSQGFEKLRWYIEEEEDVEIAQSKLQSLQLESAQIQQEYQWITQQYQLVSQEYINQASVVIGVEPRGYSPAAAQESHGQGGG